MNLTHLSNDNRHANLKSISDEKINKSLNLKSISDDQLIVDLKSLALQERKIQKQIILHIVEVDRRKEASMLPGFPTMCLR